MLNEGATIINLRGIIAVNRLPDKKQRLGTRINKIRQKQEIISASLSDMTAADYPSAAMASKWVLLFYSEQHGTSDFAVESSSLKLNSHDLHKDEMTS